MYQSLAPGSDKIRSLLSFRSTPFFLPLLLLFPLSSVAGVWRRLKTRHATRLCLVLVSCAGMAVTRGRTAYAFIIPQPNNTQS
jgi:hypothetical protein